MTARIEFEIAGLRSLARRTSDGLKRAMRDDIRKARQFGTAYWHDWAINRRQESLVAYQNCEDHLMFNFGVADE